MPPGDPILVYCHIEKAGGTTLSTLLRRHFGLRHVDVGRRYLREPDARVRKRAQTGFGAAPYHYGRADLRADLRVYPGARSLAGHLLHPFVDFEEFAPRLRWFTVLRHPLQRFRSQYLHEVEGKGRRHDIPTWLGIFRRDDMMVRKIAGEPDLEAAKQILAERVRFVGLQERFDETLVLLRHHLDIAGFRLGYPAAMNTAAARVEEPERQRERAWALEQLERHADLVRELNRNDLALYDHVERVVWPRQIAAFGGESRLRETVERDVRPGPHTPLERLRIAESLLYRNLVHKQYLRALRTWKARSLGAASASEERPAAGG